MPAKRFNSQIFLELLCYLIFAVLVLYLLISGKYLSYVTPRMKPYLIFSVAVIGLWGVAALGRLFRPQHKVRSMHCFVLVIPILLILLPHSSLDASSISGSYIGGNILSGQVNQYGTPDISAENPAEEGLKPAGEASSEIGSKLLPEDTEPTDSTVSAISDRPYYTYDSTDLRGLDEDNKKITISNEDFGMWLSEIYMDFYMNNMEKYQGYTVVVTGCILKEPEIMGEDGFVPARPMMSCCVADITPTGLLCKYDKASDLENDAWVTVEGTLFIGEVREGDISYDDPQIKVIKITPAEAVEGYVYPYY